MTGLRSIFQSPVCSTVPRGVRMIRPFDSGIECAIETSSMSNGPRANRPPMGTILTGMSGAPGSPALLAARSAAVKGVAWTGILSCGQRSRSAPKWSSCAWVSTSPRRLPGHLIPGQGAPHVAHNPAAVLLRPEAVKGEIHSDLADSAERREYELIGGA